MNLSQLLILLSTLMIICSGRKAVYRRNSRELRRLSRHFDWEMDEHGALRPFKNPNKVERAVKQCANDTEILRKIRKGYVQNKLPGGKVSVSVEVWVQEITTISDITSDFTLDIYISEQWIDPHLAYQHLNPCKQNISLNSKVLDKLWTPNSCFINSKNAEIHESPFRNVFLMIYANGTVWTNYRLKLQGPCRMKLQKFPFDNVTCTLTFESFNYNTDEVQMYWTENGVKTMQSKIELADYTLKNLTSYRVTAPYPAGLWHELSMDFHFQRKAGWYILQAYLPTILTIFISWISFTLGSKAIPARTMLGVNSLLAMTFQFGNIIRNLPRVSYVKAIDVWMLSCMTFVFCSLLELAWIGYLSRDDEIPPEKPAALNAVNAVQQAQPIKQQIQSYTAPNTANSTPNLFHRRHKTQSEEEAALLTSIRENDYGYIPPGFGLNGSIANAMGRLVARCSCDPLDTTINMPASDGYGYDPLPSSQEAETIRNHSSYATTTTTTAQLTPSHRVKEQRVQQDYEEAKKTQKYQQYINRKLYREHLSKRIDTLSIIIFPFLFSIFNILYWWYYLSVATAETEEEEIQAE